MCDRIITLIDMDCFYCQVETRYNPNLKGKPMAVVQYNQWKGGGIIAVNYEARAFGVTRYIRGNEAKQKCPEIALVHVPSVRGKADLTRYREAGREVVDVLCRFCDTVQRASVDEAYLDITQAVEIRYKGLKGAYIKPEQLMNTFVIGHSLENSNDEEERKKSVLLWLNQIYQSELHDETAEKLAIAGCIVEEMRAAVYESTGFHCSAGIAHNKILAKLACGLHKPKRQTILPQSGVGILYRNLELKKVRGLGGKFGEVVSQRLNVNFMGELQQFSETHLQKTFDEKSGSWLYNIARGFDDEAVTTRLTSKSIGCCKKFPGKLALNTKETVEHWLGELAEEVAERLEKEFLEGHRRATQFVVSYMQTIDGRDVSASRCSTLMSSEPKQIAFDAMELLKRSNTASTESISWYPPLKFLGLSAGKFVERDSRSTTIQSFFKSAPKIDNRHLDDSNGFVKTSIENKSDLCITPENTFKEEKKSKSSGKKSFFVKFFKQEGLIRSPSHIGVEEASYKKNYENPKINTESDKRQLPTGTSQQATTSEGYIGIDNKALRLMQVDESSNDSDKPVEHWVSPGEIFPNLDEVDDDVAALLPSPVQRQLRSRIKLHHEAKSAKKNKGIGKGRSKKCLMYNTSDENKRMSVLNNTAIISENTHKSLKDELCSFTCENETTLEEPNEGEVVNISQQDIFSSDSVESCKTANNLDEIQDHPLQTLPTIKGKIGTVSSDSCKDIKQSEADNSLENCSVPMAQIALNNFENCACETSSNGSAEILQIDEILKELCPHCNQLISLHEYPEHLDFHIATELDQEINKTQQNTSHQNRTVLSGSSPKKNAISKRKRGKPSQKQSAPVADKKMRSITTFFAPVR